MRSTGRSVSILAALLTLIALMWVFAMPPSAGPDEPSHMVRGAALVRGMLDGAAVDGENSFRAFELPAEVGFPDPGCFAFDEDAVAGCATSQRIPDGEAVRFTRSGDYPIWGHLLPGVGTLVPGEWNGWTARLLDALVPISIVAAALTLAARRGWMATGATLLALMPMAWFTFAVVNPSGLVIAGGIGLWTALLATGWTQGGTGRNRPRSLEPWLFAVSWAAMVLPRRDGLVYASLALALGVLIAGHDVRSLLRSLRIAPMLLVVASTVATLAWASRSDTTGSLALFAAPLAPAGAVLVRRLWRSPLLARRGAHEAVGIALGVAAIAGMFAVMSQRSDGYDRDVLRTAIGQTGTDLYEAVGILGWLDAPLPVPMLFVWLVGLGLLLGAAFFVGDGRRLAGAVGVLVVGVCASWMLTLLQNDEDGLYWQGRYYLPLLVGVPLVLGAVRVVRDPARRIGLATAVIGLLVANAGLAATIRRFAVGADGSYVPTDWNTYDTVAHPAALLLVHVIASVGLLVWAGRYVVETAPSAALGRLAALSSRSPTGGWSPAIDDGADGTAVGAALGRSGRAGVNVVGYHQVASGLGHIAREIHASLLAAGVPCAPIDVLVTDSPEIRPPAPLPDRLYDTTVAVVTAPQLPGAMAGLAEVLAASDRMIAYWFWELATVPDEHRYAIGQVDEIWTPTRFVNDAYRSAVPYDGPPVTLMPTRIERPEIDPAGVASWRHALCGDPRPRNEADTVVAASDADVSHAGTSSSDGSASDADVSHAGAASSDAVAVADVASDAGASAASAVAARDVSHAGAASRRRDDTFVFLVSLDLFSVVERKNPAGAIEAFRRAFAVEPDRRVRLVIKTINGADRLDDLRRIEDAATVDDRISVLDRYVTETELHELIAAADCYVSLHRSEGLGLHLASAMWLGTPVIATRWSGNLDLMDDSCAALVDAALIPVTNGQGAYPSTAVWADPDLDQAADWMHRLADDAATGARLTTAARSRMEQQPSRTAIGRAMNAHLSQTTRA